MRRFVHLLGVALLLGLLAYLTIPVPAYADTPTHADSIAKIKLSAAAVTLAISTIVPLLVGLLTRLNGRLKGVLSLVLNAVQTLIVQATMADGTAIFSPQTLVSWLLATVVSVATYLQVWKPLRVTSSIVDGTPGRLAKVGRTTRI